MKKIVTLLALFAVASMLSLTAPKQADARPQYLKAFTEKYPKVASEAGELKCGVCHGDMGKKKSVVSDYGKALGKALGSKNVKDSSEITAALEKAGEASAGDGKTYADLLNDGKLPPAAE